MERVQGILTAESLARAVDELAARDPDLARIRDERGAPPLWAREPGFATLLAIILEQQVSLTSARAAFARLQSLVSPLTPENFLRLDDAALRVVGFSRQKTVYARGLARAVLEGRIDLASLEEMSDEAVKSALTALKGIGAWSADVYLLMALRRPDAWPGGDLAVRVAVREVKGLPALPTPDETEAIAAAWRPWRGAAAHLLWHHYLTRPRKAGPCPARTE